MRHNIYEIHKTKIVRIFAFTVIHILVTASILVLSSIIDSILQLYLLFIWHPLLYYTVFGDSWMLPYLPFYSILVAGFSVIIAHRVRYSILIVIFVVISVTVGFIVGLVFDALGLPTTLADRALRN